MLSLAWKMFWKRKEISFTCTCKWIYPCNFKTTDLRPSFSENFVIFISTQCILEYIIKVQMVCLRSHLKLEIEFSPLVHWMQERLFLLMPAFKLWLNLQETATKIGSGKFRGLPPKLKIEYVYTRHDRFKW